MAPTAPFAVGTTRDEAKTVIIKTFDQPSIKNFTTKKRKFEETLEPKIEISKNTINFSILPIIITPKKHEIGPKTNKELSKKESTKNIKRLGKKEQDVFSRLYENKNPKKKNTKSKSNSKISQKNKISNYMTKIVKKAEEKKKLDEKIENVNEKQLKKIKIDKMPSIALKKIPSISNFKNYSYISPKKQLPQAHSNIAAKTFVQDILGHLQLTG